MDRLPSPRRALAWSVLLVGTLLSAASFWATWTVAFLLHERPATILLVASGAAALVSFLSVRFAGLLAHSKPRFALVSCVVLWVASSFLPEHVVHGYSTIPPFSLTYQGPLSFVLAAVLFASARRAADF
jgi:hypothetical protein